MTESQIQAHREKQFVHEKQHPRTANYNTTTNEATRTHEELLTQSQMVTMTESQIQAHKEKQFVHEKQHPRTANYNTTTNEAKRTHIDHNDTSKASKSSSYTQGLGAWRKTTTAGGPTKLGLNNRQDILQISPRGTAPNQLSHNLLS